MNVQHLQQSVYTSCWDINLRAKNAKYSLLTFLVPAFQMFSICLFFNTANQLSLVSDCCSNRMSSLKTSDQAVGKSNRHLSLFYDDFV